MCAQTQYCNGKVSNPYFSIAFLTWCPHCTCCKAPVKQFLAAIRSPFFQYCSPSVFQPSTRPGCSLTARERHSSALALKSGATFRHLPFCIRYSALFLNWSIEEGKCRLLYIYSFAVFKSKQKKFAATQHWPSFSSIVFKVLSSSCATSLSFFSASSTLCVSK